MRHSGLHSKWQEIVKMNLKEKLKKSNIESEKLDCEGAGATFKVSKIIHIPRSNAPSNSIMTFPYVAS